ncbi:MAG TPA: 4-hydroxy-tetrahydrodipicolinate synthase, partial [Clostridium sp.]|nr:4-hydroxy-tetrahydrodipicolinate synthase [Clostridium sp.]
IIPILSLGGSGVISVAANILPREIHDICYEYFNGNLKNALDLQLKYLSLINALFIENNPIPVKKAMNLMGMEVGQVRLPLVDICENNETILKEELSKHGLI